MSNSNYQPPSSPPSANSAQGASTLAVLSLVLGVASWIVLPLLGAIAAMIVGKLELANIAAGKSSEQGKTFAQLGFWLGAIQTGLWALSCLAGVALMAIYLLFGVALVGTGLTAQ